MLLASALPGVASSQPPPYLLQFGTPGNGNGLFSYPLGAATDAAGNVYVVDWLNDYVQKFTSTGAFITQWGTPGSGNGQLNHPYAVAVDPAGNVYVAEEENNRIQKFTGSGT